jgi:hypothetical protein
MGQFALEAANPFNGVIPKSRVFTGGTRNLGEKEPVVVQAQPAGSSRILTRGFDLPVTSVILHLLARLSAKCLLQRRFQIGNQIVCFFQTDIEPDDPMAIIWAIS